MSFISTAADLRARKQAARKQQNGDHACNSNENVFHELEARLDFRRLDHLMTTSSQHPSRQV